MSKDLSYGASNFMTLNNTSLIPEFQHFFYNYVLNSIINKNKIPLPINIDSIFIEKGSIIELLSNDKFPYNNYKYLYKNQINKLAWPTLIRNRLMIYPSSKYLIPDSTGINIFNLQNNDFLMLDVLLQYRHDSTSVTIINTDTTSDSTSFIVITDSTSQTSIVYGNINGLNTSLSKLIFLYLDLHINENYLSYYNIPNIISDNSLLATYFELKLIDDYFKYMSNREILFDISCAQQE
jgi:hypothetical protein